VIPVSVVICFYLGVANVEGYCDSHIAIAFY
jgi:hypothetical protein